MSLKDKTTLICYATSVEDLDFLDLELRQLRLIDSAKKYGINKIEKWGRQRLLKTDFYEKHRWVLEHKLGAGFWLWKPYIIYEALHKLKEDEFLLYLDCGFYLIDDPEPLLQLCKENGGFYFPEMDGEGTVGMLMKRRALSLMGALSEEYLNAPSVVANVQIYQKNEKTLAFVKDYLNWCSVPEVLVNDVFLSLQPLEGEPSNQRHLHDQSIISVLKKREGIVGFRCPYQHGNHQKPKHLRVEGEELLHPYVEETNFPNSMYPTILYYEKQGIGCKRPLVHYLQWSKVKAMATRKLSQFKTKKF
jgi:hypothetical protein